MTTRKFDGASLEAHREERNGDGHAPVTLLPEGTPAAVLNLPRASPDQREPCGGIDRIVRGRRPQRQGPDPAPIPVQDVMTTNVIALASSAFVADAARLMRRARIGAIPIVDGGRLVGILTRSDVLDAFAELSQSGLHLATRVNRRQRWEPISFEHAARQQAREEDDGGARDDERPAVEV